MHLFEEKTATCTNDLLAFVHSPLSYGSAVLAHSGHAVDQASDQQQQQREYHRYDQVKLLARGEKNGRAVFSSVPPRLIIRPPLPVVWLDLQSWDTKGGPSTVGHDWVTMLKRENPMNEPKQTSLSPAADLLTAEHLFARLTFGVWGQEQRWGTEHYLAGPRAVCILSRWRASRSR